MLSFVVSQKKSEEYYFLFLMAVSWNMIGATTK